MKLRTLDSLRLTKPTCSPNPNQVLQTPHHNKTNPGPTLQSRQQNIRGKITPSEGRPPPSPLSIDSPETKSRTLDQLRLPQLTCELNPPQVMSPPTRDEPQSYPMPQIAEYLRQDPITQETCVPIFSTTALKCKTKMLFAPMDFKTSH